MLALARPCEELVMLEAVMLAATRSAHGAGEGAPEHGAGGTPTEKQEAPA